MLKYIAHVTINLKLSHVQGATRTGRTPSPVMCAAVEAPRFSRHLVCTHLEVRKVADSSRQSATLSGLCAMLPTGGK